MRFGVFCVLVIFASIVCPRVCFAQEVVNEGYFSFDLSQNVLRDGQEVKVSFRWDIKDLEMGGQRRLTVKPFISGGAVGIYNESLDRFVGMADLNSTFPYLREEMALEFSGVQNAESPLSLNFIIYDTLIGKNYTTPAKKVWGTAYYKKYTELLNENLLKTSDVDEPLAGPAGDSVKPSDSKPSDPVKIYLWYLSPAFFLYGLLKSPNGFG